MKQALKYKDLIVELVARDLKLQYRRSFLGFFWMLILPFCTAIIYKVLFSNFFKTPSSDYPYFIYLITAFLPWNYFCSSLQRASKSILESRNIINQIAFPKYLLPLSAVLVNLINFIPSLGVLFGLMIIFKIKFSIFIFFLPVVILVHTCLIIGLSLLLSCLQVIYRDIEYLVQVVLQILFFLMPSIYTLGELIDKSSAGFVKIYMLNPLVGILDMYRVVLLGGYIKILPKEANLLNTLIIPILCSILFLALGFSVFKRMEKRLFDYLNV